MENTAEKLLQQVEQKEIKKKEQMITEIRWLNQIQAAGYPQRTNRRWKGGIARDREV